MSLSEKHGLKASLGLLEKSVENTLVKKIHSLFFDEVEDCFREGKIFTSNGQGSCTTNAKIQLIAAELFEFE